MRYLLPLLVLTAACGKNSPIGPSPTPTPSTYTLSGIVTATNGGQPLAGATIDANGVTATTDSSGRYTLTSTLQAPHFTLTGPGLLTRTGTLRGDVDAFAGGFDLGYFRQIARDGYDNPGALQPLARWTTAPNVYVRTVDAAGAPISATTLDMVARVAREMVPTWTGGAYQLAALEQGTETREGVRGWITVKWSNVVDGFCGESTVGQSGGFVDLHTGSPTCRCNGYATRPRTIRHELGHSLGLRHTDRPEDVMTSVSRECDAQPSAREREYAAYLYRRPVGSTDLDNDP